MQKLLITILFIFSNVIVYGQIFISGNVITKDNAPVEFAELILEKDEITVKSGLSDSTGNFRIGIPPGQYKIIVRYQGEDFFNNTLRLDKDTDLGSIVVDNSKLIKEVTINAKKKLITLRPDGLVYNVQNSPFANGVSANELLKNIPRIDPLSDELKIIGKSGVTLLINDRPLNISGQDLKNYLSSIRSENIEKVEVITSPSSKYDAAGNSGVINIVLKKKATLGFDGNVSSTFSQRTKPTTENSSTLNYSSNKLIISYNIFYGYQNRSSRKVNNYFFPDLTRTSNENTGLLNKGLSHNFSLDYAPFKQVHAGFFFNYDGWDNNSSQSTKTRDVSENVVQQSQNLPSATFSKYKGLGVSPYVDIKLDSLGSKIQLYYNYNDDRRNSNSKYNTFTYDDNLKTLKSQSQSTSDIHNEDNVNSAGADVTLHLRKSVLELGGKYTAFHNGNDLRFYDILSDEAVLNDSVSNSFKYSEKILALYSNISRSIGQYFNLNAGIRYEYTHEEGILITNNSVDVNHYGNLFPSVSLTYDPNDSHSFSISYNRRITRPSLSELNPFRVYTDANDYQIGNPELRPSITDNIELGYVYKGNLSFSLFGSKTINSWQYVTEAAANNNMIVTQPQNALTSYNSGVEIDNSWDITPKINNYSSVTASYTKSTSNNINIPDAKLKGMSATLSSNTTFILSKTNKIFVNMLYETPGVEDMFFSKSIFLLRLGTSLSFLSKRLTVNAFLTDPFKTTINRNTVHYSTYLFKNRIDNDNRSVSVSLTYKFGNNKAKTSGIKVNNSEKDRLLKSN